MAVSSRKWQGALVPVFLVAQFVVGRAALRGERPPPPPALGLFPAALGHWRLFREDPIDAPVAKDLNADRLLSESYVDTTSGSIASLLVAWFRTQREGSGEPHSPKVCLPAAGWTPRVSGEITVETAAGPIRINRYIVDRDAKRTVVLYWYQTPRRVMAGEWAAKFWLANSALLDRRTDAALVRVITWPSASGDERATATAVEFAQRLYPILREYLPH